MLPPPTTRPSEQPGRGESPTIASVHALLAILIVSSSPTPQDSIARLTNTPPVVVPIPLCGWRPAVNDWTVDLGDQKFGFLHYDGPTAIVFLCGI